MKQTPHSPVRMKNAGGVRSVLLAPTGCFDVEFEDDGARCTIKTPFHYTLMQCEPDCDGSSFDERLEIKNGVRTVTHTLTLLSDRNGAQAWLETDFLSRLRFDGALAVVELNDGRRLLAGMSSRLYDEYPLKLRSATALSGCRPADVPQVKLVLEYTDDAFAAEIDLN